MVFDSYELLVDTIPNPGDDLFLRLTLRNNGSTASATAITADISTSDTCVTDLELLGQNTFGDVAAGETGTISGAHRFTLNENCPGGSEIALDISIASDGFFFWQASFTIGVLTGLADEAATIPESYSLSQNYPNPFNPETVLRYALPNSSNLSLVIYNLMGQEVIRWDEQNVQPGYYEKTWNGTNKFGVPVGSGVYLYRLVAGDFIETRKMILLK